MSLCQEKTEIPTYRNKIVPVLLVLVFGVADDVAADVAVSLFG